METPTISICKAGTIGPAPARIRAAKLAHVATMALEHASSVGGRNVPLEELSLDLGLPGAGAPTLPSRC
jgi:hypothetical protein